MFCFQCLSFLIYELYFLYVQFHTIFFRYILKGRVVIKSPMKTFSTGRVFSFDLMDDSGIIRCVAYHEVANKIFDQIEVNRLQNNFVMFIILLLYDLI